MSNPFPKADPNIDGELLLAARKVRCYELAKVVIERENKKLKREEVPTIGDLSCNWELQSGIRRDPAEFPFAFHETRMLAAFAQLLFEVACGNTSLIPNGMEQERARELLDAQKVVAGGQLLGLSKHADVNARRVPK